MARRRLQISDHPFESCSKLHAFPHSDLTMRRLLSLLAVSLLAIGAIASPTLATDNGNQLVKIDQKVGTGPVANSGDDVQVNYTGWLYDANAKDHHGAKFDSSYDNGGEPIKFTLGSGAVIAGWDQGIEGMRVGGKRTLVIPARLGYGARGAGDDIPPNATLIFDVELVRVN
jgi:FKBP-type peptidyl-prolyl cis-trans isomerase FkpA